MIDYVIISITTTPNTHVPWLISNHTTTNNATIPYYLFHVVQMNDKSKKKRRRKRSKIWIVYITRLQFHSHTGRGIKIENNHCSLTYKCNTSIHPVSIIDIINHYKHQPSVIQYDMSTMSIVMCT